MEKRMKTHQITHHRKTHSRAKGHHQLADWNTACQSNEEEQEVTVRWDTLPQAASLQGSQDSVLPDATVVSRRGSRDGALLSELLCCASLAETVKETKSPGFHLGHHQGHCSATSCEGKVNWKVKAHTLHHGEGSFLLNFKHYKMYLSGRGKCDRVPVLPPKPPNNRKPQSIISPWLTFSSRFRFRSLLDFECLELRPSSTASKSLSTNRRVESSRKGLRWSEKEEELCQRQNSLLRVSGRVQNSHRLLQSYKTLFKCSCNPANAVGPATRAQEASGICRCWHLELRKRAKKRTSCSEEFKLTVLESRPPLDKKK